ncbi:hypothetical protein HYO65_gp194 [Tenacibaculum phage PTm1]|uniref:Uncharacterized protein n=1 Tax=Tenacibaculum phage PTm1 TaxID=2547425 RepID=A0A5S9HXA6_9CAUD|nr:hypothetical protein HYO65_gp194 [Tenacibaculum phage PTm1]BBI90586.1 hypothetical protein [Tenacibaculum phage PTm1]
MGFHVMYKITKHSSKSILYIPIRNKEKIEISENLERLKK